MADNNWTEITYRIVHWLNRNDVNLDNARIIIELPSSHDVAKADAGLKMDLKPYELTLATVAGMDPLQINGIYLEFRRAGK